MPHLLDNQPNKITMNTTNNTESTGSILDQIKEQTTNLEHIITANNITSTLTEALEEFGRKERTCRESTIAFKISETCNFDKISDIIECHWTQSKAQAPATFWKDKDHTYAQFVNKETRDVFIKFIKDRPEFDSIRHLIREPNSDGHYLSRKPVRIIIPSVPEAIKTEKLDLTLKNLASSTANASVAQIRAGKVYGQARKMKSLMTNVNSAGFQLLFKSLGGSLPYNDTNLKIKVYPKIACKPWSCKECFFIGPNHNCQGKACAQCGNRGHSSKDCKSKTRFCTNCKRPGHRAKDANCPIFIKEIVKELKRMDIPLEVLESKTRRTELIKVLSFK